MHAPPSPSAPGAFGPHPKHAILPVMAVVGFCGWLYLQHRGLVLEPTATDVTVMRPVTEADASTTDTPAAGEAGGDAAAP